MEFENTLELTRPPRPFAWRRIWAVRVLSGIAVVDLAYLLFATLTSTPLACTPGGFFDCSAALASSYAYIGPIPISAAGLLVYGLIFGISAGLTSARSPRAQEIAWTLLALLSSMAACMAIWLVTAQLTNISPMCPYCMVAHTIGMILAIVILKSSPLSPTLHAKLIGVAIFAALLFSGTQITFPHKEPTNIVRIAAGVGGGTVTSLDDPEPNDGKDFDTGPGPGRQLGILGGKVRLSPRQFPLAGSPDAPSVVVVLFDHTCPNCRKLHQYLQSANKRFPGQFAVVMLAVPLDKACNPHVGETESSHRDGCALAKISLAVWIAKPSEFALFNNWMMDRDETVSVKAARAEAARRIGADTLEATLNDERVERELRKGITAVRLLLE